MHAMTRSVVVTKTAELPFAAAAATTLQAQDPDAHHTSTFISCRARDATPRREKNPRRLWATFEHADFDGAW